MPITQQNSPRGLRADQSSLGSRVRRDLIERGIITAPPDPSQTDLGLRVRRDLMERGVITQEPQPPAVPLSVLEPPAPAIGDPAASTAPQSGGLELTFDPTLAPPPAAQPAVQGIPSERPSIGDLSIEANQLLPSGEVVDPDDFQLSPQAEAGRGVTQTPAPLTLGERARTALSGFVDSPAIRAFDPLGFSRELTKPREDGENSLRGEVAKGFVRGGGQLIQSAAGLGQFATGTAQTLGNAVGISDSPIDTSFGDTFRELGRKSAEIEQLARSDSAEGVNPLSLRWWLAAGGEQIPQLSAQIGLAGLGGGGAALTKFGIGGGLFAGGLAFNDAYEQQLSVGATPEQAQTSASIEGVAVGAATAFLEKLGGAAVFNKVPGFGRLFKNEAVKVVAQRAARAGLAATGEATTEMAQEAFQIAAGIVMRGEEFNKEEFKQALAAAGLLGFGIGGGINVATGGNIPAQQQDQAIPQQPVELESGVDPLLDPNVPGEVTPLPPLIGVEKDAGQQAQQEQPKFVDAQTGEPAFQETETLPQPFLSEEGAPIDIVSPESKAEDVGRTQKTEAIGTEPVSPVPRETLETLSPIDKLKAAQAKADDKIEETPTFKHVEAPAVKSIKQRREESAAKRAAEKAKLEPVSPKPKISPETKFDASPESPLGKVQQRAAEAKRLRTTSKVFEGGQFEEARIPLEGLAVNKDIPQFKGLADPVTGEVKPIPGTFDPASPPIFVWERTDGSQEVASGRHRVALARRSGESDIGAFILKESEGWDVQRVGVLDAVQNIRDERGAVEDYARFFKRANYTEAQAREDGLLESAKGRAGLSLGLGAGENLWAGYSGGQIPEAQAAAIAEAAPRNEAIQLAAIKYLDDNAGTTAEKIGAVTRSLQLFGGKINEDASQGDLFGGFDDSAIKSAEALATVALKYERGLRDQANAVRGAAKRPEQAKALGVDISDPESVRLRVKEIDAELERVKNWERHKDLRERFARDADVELLSEPRPVLESEPTAEDFFSQEPAPKPASEQPQTTPKPVSEPPPKPKPNDPAPEGVTFEDLDPERSTAAMNKMMARDAKALGLEGLPSKQKNKRIDIFRAAVREGFVEKAPEINAEFAAGTKRPLSTKEQAGLVAYTVNIKNRITAQNKILKDGSEEAGLNAAAEIDRLKMAFDQSKETLAIGGSELGESLGFRNLVVDENYDPISLKRQAQAKKGEPLTPKEAKKWETRAGELEALNAKLTEQIEADQASRVDEFFADRGKRRRSKKSIKALDAELSSLAAETQALIKSGCPI